MQPGAGLAEVGVVGVFRKQIFTGKKHENGVGPNHYYYCGSNKPGLFFYTLAPRRRLPVLFHAYTSLDQIMIKFTIYTRERQYLPVSFLAFGKALPVFPQGIVLELFFGEKYFSNFF